MKKQIRNTLAGLLLASSPLAFQNCSVERPYVENSINNTTMLNKVPNSKYQIQGTVYFDKLGKDKGYFKTQNNDLEEGELSFILQPADETTIVEEADGKVELIPSNYLSNQYIPTKVENENKETLEIFELNNLPKEIEKKLLHISKNFQNKSRRTSQNISGYAYEINESDLQKILPMENVNGQNLVYVNSEWGNFIDTAQNQVKKYIIEKDENRKSLLLTPEKSLSIGVDPSSKKIVLINKKGFFNPIKENLQTKTKPKSENNLEDKATSNHTYKVKKGDTFWELSRRFYGNEKDAIKLMEKNNYKNPKELQVGDVIKY
jgi:LysM repeat protein